MPGIFHDYPYTSMHEINLDYILRIARQTMGLHLEIVGDKLQLKTADGTVVSNVTVSYATKALQDANGTDIDTYLISAGTSGTQLVFTNGRGNITAVTVPYATIAKEDDVGHDIVDYVISASVAGDKVRFTKGDGTIFEITVPFATKAGSDANGKDLSTYAATIAPDGNELVLRDSMGRELSRITVGYATKALKDNLGNVIDATYGASLVEGTTTIKLRAANGSIIDEITVPYATHAGSAYENITIVGDQLVFTKGDGTQTTITIPYAVKALKDDLGNTIKSTYVANVVNDPQTGKITFYDATGTALVEMTPTVTSATEDALGNTLSDYINSVANSVGSNYVTVTHGDGTVDSVTIHYAETAWKDSNNNVIKNFYVSYLDTVIDPNDSKFYLVAYNGDNPRAELFRVELPIPSSAYVTTIEADSVDDKKLDAIDGDGNVVSQVTGAIAVTYTAATEDLAIDVNVHFTDI